jgi:hypothetical protein
MLLLVFVFFFLQFAMVSAIGNYIQYASFMGARAYLAAGRTETDQQQRAKDTMIRMLKRSTGQAGIDRWGTLVEGTGGEPGGVLIGKGDQAASRDALDPTFSWQEGVRYRFRSKLFLGWLGGDSSISLLELVSESWLGREPNYDECLEDIRGRVGQVVIDNGC